MDDSHFSHSACQLVPEIEAESRLYQDQERNLVQKSFVENSNPLPNNKITKDINGTKGLFAMEPRALRIIGGAISRCSRNSTIKEFQPLQY